MRSETRFHFIWHFDSPVEVYSTNYCLILHVQAIFFSVGFLILRHCNAPCSQTKTLAILSLPAWVSKRWMNNNAGILLI